ncbi:MAG: hypothetical protein EBS07_12185 [Sphingobacteriia bacterium]|nr:hypothetical protein [Sphingobacteriia bacterium]
MKRRIFVISFIVFAILNIIENLIHFNIGRNSSEFISHFDTPNHTEWFNIISTMFVFAFLQAALTYIFV